MVVLGGVCGLGGREPGPCARTWGERMDGGEGRGPVLPGFGRFFPDHRSVARLQASRTDTGASSAISRDLLEKSLPMKPGRREGPTTTRS